MSDLSNPIWSSLSTRHAHLARVHGRAMRYPEEIAPFAAMDAPSAEAEQDLLDLVSIGETVCLLNILPASLDGWEIRKEFDAYQYVWEGEMPSPDPMAMLLGPEDLGAMLDLTALVYPAYFRKGTAELGDYYGFFEGEQLCAMAGIRMAMTGFQEIGAICTHPDHRGRGLASRLTNHLIHLICTQSDTPFLHTEHDNKAAQSIYEKLGFRRRGILALRLLQRGAS